MKLKPLPPAVYTYTCAAIYAMVGVGSIGDVTGITTLPALLIIATATMAVLAAITGRRDSEMVCGALLLPLLCITFALAPSVSPAWGIWGYAAFVVACAIIGGRVTWLCKL